MPRKGSWNPIAFVPVQVTITAYSIYIALFAVLIWVHTVVPSAPRDPTPVDGLNLTQAWWDLEQISSLHHPLDSRADGQVRSYLLERVKAILRENEKEYKIVKSLDLEVEQEVKKHKNRKGTDIEGPKAVTVFDDLQSNVTFSYGRLPWACYGESENIIVYIRGADDERSDWWATGVPYSGSSGVLVNAHFDSVASGYGATDDGVGVVTVLQLISYFTRKGHQPKRGLVALLNDGEEAGLYGAYNFLQHPLSQFTHTFLNLEGAGAGGRATLFRSTDAEVTSFYSSSPYPFGTVISGDGFKRGFIRSSTDYSVFNGVNHMRGLDVAFFEPRARYHTNQDDARDTSEDSLWHMLSTSLATTKAMTAYVGDEFEGPVRRDGTLDVGSGSVGVWFDLFGRAFALLRLQTLFAVSVALLAAGPLLLIALQIVLTRSDKWYPLSRRKYLRSAEDDQAVHFSGLRGLFRFPVAFVASSAAVLALAYLLAKMNPLIVYSSEYAVWTMMLSAWLAVCWFFLALGDRVRPTALQRMYVLIWLYAITWVLLVGGTVGENNFDIGSGYVVVIYHGAVFVALLISYLELFALPTKTSYVEHVLDADQDIERRSARRNSQSSRTRPGHGEDRPRSSRVDDEDEPTERSSLLGRGDRRTGNTFMGAGKRHPDTDGTLEETDDPYLTKAYGDEQAWSSSLPQWTWILQFLVLTPINLVIVGQVSLLLTSAVHQTPADGNSPLSVYLIIAVLTITMMLPLTPFLHRFLYQIPTFLFLVFAGCLAYNLLAFPFSRDARLKVYPSQVIDLNTGINNMSVTGLSPFLRDIVSELPSTAGQNLDCRGNEAGPTRDGLVTCKWHGLAPNVLATTSTVLWRNHTDSHNYSSWLDYNIVAPANSSTASITLRGRNTKQCRITFSTPFTALSIADSSPNNPHVFKSNSEVRLFSREWDKAFQVNVSWTDGASAKGQVGRVGCMWNDVNTPGTIPAWDELEKFVPVWSTIAVSGHGIVEGWKDFVI